MWRYSKPEDQFVPEPTGQVRGLKRPKELTTFHEYVQLSPAPKQPEPEADSPVIQEDKR